MNCRVASCEKPVQRGIDLCAGHYQRKRRFGDVQEDVPIHSRGTYSAGCAVHGCDKPHASFGFCSRHSTIWSKYKMHPQHYENLRAEQDYRCAICRTPEDGNRLVVDHCHRTGNVRDLLCAKCNTALGMMCDTPARLDAAAAYLRQHATAPAWT